MADGGDLIMLMDKAQLKKLALLLRNNEEALMSRVTKSQNERFKYLKSVNDAYDKAVSLLDDSTAMNDRYAQERGGGGDNYIAEDILGYIKICLNMSMQNVRNCYMRESCIDKIKAHYDSLVAHLNDPKREDVGRIAKDTAKFKECMWEYCHKYRSGSARALSKLYSMRLKQERIKFPDLVRRHQNKFGLQGSQFEDLTQAQKLEVYNSIIEESGRAKIPKLRLEMEPSSAALGVPVLVVTAGVMVWDIFTAEHKMEAVVRNTLIASSAVSRAAFPVKVAVDAFTEAVVEIQPGVFTVSLPWFVAGVVAGLIVDAASGLLMDIILGTGGTKPPQVTDLSFHTATMPDGMAFANSIARGYY